MNAKTIKIVVTGGPCRGKTEVIDELEKHGCRAVHEIAREVIEECDRQEINLENKDLEEIIYKRQIEIEKNLASLNGCYFLDRGTIDCATYSKIDGNGDGDAREFEKQVLEEGKNRYNLVFLLDALPYYEKDAQRKESKEKAAFIHEKIKQAYETTGYKLVVVPWLGSHKKRAEFILSHVMKTVFGWNENYQKGIM